MVQPLQPTTDDIFYPESDGKPWADNTLQFELITTIKYGLEVRFKDDPNVFVAGDLLWYPVQGKPKINQALDVMVVVGRPKGHRRSYKTWVEDNLNPQVVFEIASETNTIKELESERDRSKRFGSVLILKGTFAVASAETRSAQSLRYPVDSGKVLELFR